MINSLRRTWPSSSGQPDDIGPLAPPSRSAHVLGLLAATGIGVALLVMIGAAAIRQDWMLPRLPMPAAGPPFEVHWVHLSTKAVDTALWLAEITGALGVAAGLLAAARGLRPPMRLIVATAVVALAALTMLPPAGSTDALDYATYGRLLVLGHNPVHRDPVAAARYAQLIRAVGAPRMGRPGQPLRPVRDIRAADRGQARRDFGGPHRVLAEAVELRRLRPGGHHPGPDAVRPARPAAARSPAVDAQPAAAVGPDRGRARRHAGRRGRAGRPAGHRGAGAGDQGRALAGGDGRRADRRLGGHQDQLHPAGRRPGLGAAPLARRAGERRGRRPARAGAHLRLARPGRPRGRCSRAGTRPARTASTTSWPAVTGCPAT